MERVFTLIDKLYQQKQQNASPSHLLFTVQMIHAELLQLQQKHVSLGTSKVAVSLPVNLNFVDELVRNALQAGDEALPAVDEKPEPTPILSSKTTPKSAAESETYSLQQPLEVEAKPVVMGGTPIVIEFEPKIESAAPTIVEPNRQPEVPETKPTTATAPTMAKSVLNPAFHIEPDMPTLGQYEPKPQTTIVEELPAKEVYELKPSREIHELLGKTQESLNDRLKENKTELGHKLTGAPVKDLRKAIGINDRFTFISELFRGDEVMYERSLKTINDFNVYSEAEYWINRELRFKLGWVDTQPMVQHFYHLVRRRFS